MAKSVSAKIKQQSTVAWNARAKNSAQVINTLVDACQHAWSTGDWTLIAHNIQRAKASGAAPKEVSNAMSIVRAVLPGITSAIDEKQPTGIRMSLKKVEGISNSGVDIARVLADKKVSIAGTAIANAFKPEEEKGSDKTFTAKSAEVHKAAAKRFKTSHSDVELVEKIKDLKAQLAAFEAVASNKVNH